MTEGRARRTGARTTVAGPIAETTAADTVFVHTLAEDLAPELVRVLRERLGPRLVRTSHGYLGPRSGYDTASVWVRDYHPHFVRGEGGALEAVSFLSENPARSGVFADQGVPVRAPRPNARFFPTSGSQPRWLDTRTVPILHEHGNLVSTGDWVLVTDKVAADNAVPRSNEHLTRAGYEPRSRAAVMRLLAENLRVDERRIIELPRMPGERTGHVDTFVLAIGEGEVLVPEVRIDQLAQLDYAHERELGHQVRRFLDAQAARLSELGLTVHRLPMLAPVYLEREGGRWMGNFYTPANSLLLNAGNERLAVMPTFDATGFPDAYRAKNAAFQREWSDFFRARGYEPVAVDATRLGRANGLFRCLTAIAPES